MKKPKREGEPAPIQEVLPPILRGLRGTMGGPVGRVRRAWGEIVGPSIFQRTRIAGVADGHVSVEVASAALKHDLSVFRQAEVLSGLREKLPDMAIQGVSYRVAALR